jgi:hypothetical protein
MTSKGKPILFVLFTDKGYTCSSDLNSRLGDKDTARVKVNTTTKCQLIYIFITYVGKSLSFLFL